MCQAKAGCEGSCGQWERDLRELEGAEEFLDYFSIPYDERVVQVNRLHILQRFHDYLVQEGQPAQEPGGYERHRRALARAYDDFVRSDARTEKVFKLFRSGPQVVAFVPIEQLRSR